MDNNSSPTLQAIYKQVFGDYVGHKDFLWKHRGGFVHYIQAAIENGLIDTRLSRKHFKLEKLSYCLDPERDSLLTAQDVKTLAPRLIRSPESNIVETPQYYWMRLAMERSLRAGNPTRAALTLYDEFSLNPQKTLHIT